MNLYFGDAFALLDELKPRFILTDSNVDTFAPLIHWCERHDVICISAYSIDWLTRVHAHPAQKHVEPYRRIIRAFPQAEVICDPFMGSGSIGEAALMEGRDFIGIEKIRQWFDIAEARLNGVAHALARADRAVG